MMKKQLIMEKALELFAKQGFETTTIQQITEYCGISKGAFYLSFKSKDELILAIIDQFMAQYSSEIDYIVRNTEDTQELLYKFYYATFSSFHKHSDFAKVLIKEQAHTFNAELIGKLHFYDKLLENTILLLIERLYNEKVSETKYDLIYCIKGFMNMFSQLFLFYNVPLDIELLVQSLVEKTNLLAANMTTPFISKELGKIFVQPIQLDVSKEQILEQLEQKISALDDSVVKESLLLLQQDLREPGYPAAIVRGLLENIRLHPQCKWVAYLLRQHYQL